MQASAMTTVRGPLSRPALRDPLARVTHTADLRVPGEEAPPSARQDDGVEVTVRRAHRDEASTLTALHHRTALSAFRDIFPSDAPLPSFEEDLARWQHWLGPDADHGRSCYVASAAGGQPVGVVLAGPDPDEPFVGHLARLYVDPDLWGHGIGTALYDVAIADLAARFTEATLWVLEDNVRARGWYERLGWQLTPLRKATYAPAGVDDVQYRITLDAHRTAADRH
jgi:ribosomal protein S18 acetylase RimI-like enzyme